MIDNKNGANPNLSAAERKTLRSREAKEAIAEHEEAQRVLHGNLERLREKRLAREEAAGLMLNPAPELPDDTPIENVRFPTKIRNALNAAGMKTIGEVRETSDDSLIVGAFGGRKCSEDFADCDADGFGRARGGLAQTSA